MTTLQLTKHHGLGNDFLVLVDPDSAVSVDAELARRLCHRNTGVGADGLLWLTRPAGLLVMRLHNADGSRAEMSGNGIRCFVQAAVDAGLAEEGTVDVLTDAGVKRVDVGAETAPGLRQVTVDMGPATLREEGPAAYVDMGNPHLVLRVDEPARAPLEQWGRKHPDLNVELIAVAGPDTLEMRVHERGVGETLACGTGACAAAAAAHHWGLVGASVTVRQPGGDAVVDLGADGGNTSVSLTGPTQLIARIEVEV